MTSLIGPIRPVWVDSILFWKYDGDEIFMHDLWYFSLGLLLCVAAHAEVYIVKTLRMHPWSRVKFPDVEKMREYAAMIQAREPSVDDVIGFMDGVLFFSECSDERVEQNAFYCGYDSDTMVNNVFAYGPNGKVFFAAMKLGGRSTDCLDFGIN